MQHLLFHAPEPAVANLAQKAIKLAAQVSIQVSSCSSSHSGIVRLIPTKYVQKCKVVWSHNKKIHCLTNLGCFDQAAHLQVSNNVPSQRYLYSFAPSRFPV